MFNAYFKLIDKKLVHKKNEKNVFIYNLRRIIPLTIKKEIFVNNILYNITNIERKLILSYYSLYNINNEDYYILNSCIPELKPEEIDSLNNGKKESILKYYDYNKSKKKYILKTTIEDNNEIEILKILNKKNKIVTSNNKAKIAEIFEKIYNIERENKFFANMYINIIHEFFFEHSVEHVPGMMLLEALRQYVVACCHIYGKIPQENVNVILDHISVNFYSFAELNYPINIVGEVRECKYNPEGYWSYLDIAIDVYQNDFKITEFFLKGKSVSSKLFQRFRRKKMELLNKSRFIPYPDINYKISIQDPISNEYYDTEIVNISTEGFMLKHNKNDKIKKYLEYDFIFYLNEIGFIKGKCKNIWHNKKHNAGYKIMDISDNDKKRLYETINKFFYVHENRENHVNDLFNLKN